MKKLYILLSIFLYIGCNIKYNDIELKNLQKGDTVYVMDLGKVMLTTIIHNDTIKEVVQLNIGNKLNINELNLYKKECWTYKELKKGRGNNDW